MRKYVLSKTFGIVLGTLTIIAMLGYGFMFFLGKSLGQALNSEIDSSSTNKFTLVILITLLTVSVITGAGSFALNWNVWRMVYSGFC
ncbi:hypothetical protein [Neobacillus niacini]|uniref:hypothetical protein n=1 Tax=Neobacillus niacini TaxID=86668 RepID=UPI002859ADCD|nr:hypothetical protein [Neobacillus niacini]MDR6999293.1 flagellar basal body-associated protein FliL [Neobacillus niacini]